MKNIEDTLRPPDERPSKTPGQNGAETILIVEDEPDLRELVSQVLSSQGYNVIEASSGKEALAHWSSRKSDIGLVLTDMVMCDGMTGYKLAEQLRADAPNLRIIFTSGHAAGVPGTQLADMDERQFLAKPFRPSELIDIVRATLAH